MSLVHARLFEIELESEMEPKTEPDPGKENLDGRKLACMENVYESKRSG